MSRMKIIKGSASIITLPINTLSVIMQLLVAMARLSQFKYLQVQIQSISTINIMESTSSSWMKPLAILGSIKTYQWGTRSGTSTPASPSTTTEQCSWCSTPTTTPTSSWSIAGTLCQNNLPLRRSSPHKPARSVSSMQSECRRTGRSSSGWTPLPTWLSTSAPLTSALISLFPLPTGFRRPLL